MAVDLFEHAQKLRVVDVWKAGNETGWITPRSLYDPSVNPPGHDEPVAPRLQKYQFWMDHGTVGTNTLRYWCEGGSIASGDFSLAQYLIPRDTTVYKDQKVHDTQDVVFKMVPDGFACNHAGVCITPITNSNTKGVEYESRQDGITHDITERQYIKGALIYAYDSLLKTAQQDIKDWWRVPHGLVAKPWGRRRDPWAGFFKIGYSWALVEQARNDPRIRALWGL